MKKVLSFALALLMLCSLLCIAPVMAAEADGSAENPYYVATGKAAPGTIVIPAHDAVYYQYKSNFDGWQVGGVGLTSITVDGVVFDTPDMWGAIYATLDLSGMKPGVVGYVNDTDEEVEVYIEHMEPLGSVSNPDTLVTGENVFSIPANVYPYVAEYCPTVSGEYTFVCDQAEDFDVTVIVDGVEEVLNGSLTLTLESYIPVQVSVSPIGVTPDVVITIIAPKAGTEENPIWVSTDEIELPYVLTGTEKLWFNVDAYMGISALVVESANGAEFTVEMDGVAYASEGGLVKIAVGATDSYCYAMAVYQDADVETEIGFSAEYPAGAAQNPIKLEMGNNTISIPANADSGCYYYVDIVEDGALVATPSTLATIGYMDMYDAEYERYAWLPTEEEASFMKFNVLAGDRIYFSISGAMDEETFEVVAVDMTLTLSMVDSDLILGDANGDGKVNNRDLGILQQYLNDWDVTVDEAAADLNADGRVNNRDLGLLQQQLNA